MKKAVILFNLGGPDNLSNVEPFLFNLFNDPAIISIPSIFRYPLAKFISKRRAPIAKNIYKEIGNNFLTKSTELVFIILFKFISPKIGPIPFLNSTACPNP